MSRDASMSSANFDSDTGVGVESEQEVESQEPKPIPPAEPPRTKVYYYIDKEPEPFVTIINIPVSQLTLHHLKVKLPKTNFKYYNHQSVDGHIERIEVRDDEENLLPLDNGNVFVTCLTDEQATPIAPPVPFRQHAKPNHYVPPPHHRNSRMKPPNPRLNRRRAGSFSKLPRHYTEDTDFYESDVRAYSDEESSVITDFTSVSQQNKRRIHRHARAHRARRMSPSFNSTTLSDASMAVDVLRVRFDLSQGALGLTVLTSKTRTGHIILVDDVRPGSLSARDGRIRKNMLILEVNDQPLDGLSIEDAVEYLSAASRRENRFIDLTFAQTEHERFNPSHEVTMPIDTRTWVRQTMIQNQMLPSIYEGTERRSPNPLKLVYNPYCLNAGGFPSSGVGSSVCSMEESIPNKWKQPMKVKQGPNDRALLPTTQKPAMDDTMPVPQKNLAYKLKRFFCVQPKQSATTKKSSAVRQINDENVLAENSPPNIRSADYLMNHNHMKNPYSTHIP